MSRRPLQEALADAVRGIAEVLEVERVLQLIVDRVRDLAEAEYAALGMVDEAGVIERFITRDLQRRALAAAFVAKHRLGSSGGS